MKTIDHSKHFFNKDIMDKLSEEVFKRNDSLEIIAYLESSYQNSILISNNKIDDINEQILLNFNNTLVNLYLIRYCKSINTFFYLLEANPSLISQGIFNDVLISSIYKKLIPYLLKDIDILRIFFNYYLESNRIILLKEFIDKESGFELIKDKTYFKILETIFGHKNFVKILEEEAEPYVELSDSRITYSIWRVLEKANVDEMSIEALSVIGGTIHQSYMSIPYGNKSSIDSMLDKWSNYKNNKIEKDAFFNFRTSSTDNLSKIYIQMLIASYSNHNSSKSNYSGVRAYAYMYNHIEYFITGDYDSTKFKDFIVLNNRNTQEKDKMFDYFKYNVFNYTESFFKIAYEGLELDKELILKNFEKIGKSITIMEWWEIEELLENNFLDESQKKYYKTLYYLQRLELDNSQISELIYQQNKVIDIVLNKKTTLW